jgi:hypothetical protein
MHLKVLYVYQTVKDSKRWLLCLEIKIETRFQGNHFMQDFIGCQINLRGWVYLLNISRSLDQSQFNVASDYLYMLRINSCIY